MGKVALITGASQGIGACVAHRLANLGYDPALLSRNKEKLAKLQASIQSEMGNTVTIHPTDVSNINAVNQAIKEVIKQHQRIDVLFNNAGIAIAGTSEIAPADFEKLMQVNVLGAYYVLHAVIPQMKAQGSGYIFNLASRSGVSARPQVGAYGATKYALRGYNEALYKELAPLGIKVTALHPGWVNTEMTSDVNIPNEKKIQTKDIAELVEALLKLAPYTFIKEITIEPQRAIELMDGRP